MATPHAMGGGTQKPHSKAWLVSGMTSRCGLPLHTGRPWTDTGVYRWGCPPVGFGGSRRSPVSPRSPSVGLDGTSTEEGAGGRGSSVCSQAGGSAVCSSSWEGPLLPTHLLQGNTCEGAALSPKWPRVSAELQGRFWGRWQR